MAAICRFFDEDAVYRINKKKFVDVGLVLENSEFLSSDEEEPEDTDCPEWQRMKRGHVRIAWHPNGREEVLSEKKVRLFDRSLMPGDVVRKLVKGKDAQLGYCRNTSVKAAVQVVGTKQVVIGVDSNQLFQMEEFQADVAVFRNSWVGMVKAVKSDLTLVFPDGSKCIMSDLDALDMDDILDKRERSSEFKKFSFYPCQQLYGPPYCFENVKWLNLNNTTEEALKNLSRSVRVTVESVKVVSLGVQWVCRAYREETKCDSDVEQPKYLIMGDDLKSIKMMNIFEPCTLQIGDRNYLVIKDNYRIISLNDWRSEMAALLKLPGNFPEIPISKPKPSSSEKPLDAEGDDMGAVCNGVEGSDSEFEDIDDDDDDGIYSDSTSVTSHSTSSVDRNKGPKHKTKKGPSLATKMLKRKKIRRARRRVAKEILPLKPGDKVVTETLITETKAHVVWQDGSVENDVPSTHLYPVHHLDGHEFFPGDFVVDNKDSRPYEYGVVKQVDHNGRTALVTWMKTYHAGAEPHPEILNEEEVSVYDIKDHPDFRYRPGSCVIRVANFEDSDPESTAGQVVDVHPSGKVEVSWVNGKQSLCYPQELYRVGEYDSDDLWGDDESFCDEEESWETESEASEIGTDENNDKEFGDASRLCEHSALKALDKDDEKSADDSKSMQEKLLANIEKLRAGMARLEEVFTQNPTLQTCNVMRRLLELYKHCKVLDQLLGTTYFHEKHLQSLIEKLRHRGRVNSIQHMADQISRLFSIGISSPQTESVECGARDQNSDFCYFEQAARDSCVTDSESRPDNSSSNKGSSGCNMERPEFSLVIEAPSNNDVATDTSDNPCLMSDSKLECGLKNTGVLLSPMGMPLMSNGSEPRNICQQLCAILKSRLLKAHEDVEQRFGMSHSDTTALLAAEMDALPTDQSDVCSPDASAAEIAMPECKELNATNDDTLASGDVADEDTTEKEEECTAGQGVFSVLESVPDNHKYKLSILQPNDTRAFFRRVRKEMQILRSSLPDGIIVKGFEDRIDLYSVMIKGPKRTPYEDGLFFFDFQLPAEYPKVPPHCHYISYCSDRLNPNLYEGGKVCVSLLGTWGGKGTEVWSQETSNLLQVIVSIQGLILVSEPYYNEAGYERQRGTQVGKENSRIYNEMVILKLVQAMTKLVLCPPEVFKEEITEHFSSYSSKFIHRLERWLTISDTWNSVHPTTPASPTVFREFHGKTCCDSSSQESSDIPLPEFPLIPASKGFCLTLRKSLESFKDAMTSSSIQLS